MVIGQSLPTHSLYSNMHFIFHSILLLAFMASMASTASGSKPESPSAAAGERAGAWVCADNEDYETCFLNIHRCGTNLWKTKCPATCGKCECCLYTLTSDPKFCAAFYTT